MTQVAAPSIDIGIKEKNIVQRLLHRYLLGVEVWAYGSRVRWNARSQSDLDLVAFASPEHRGAVSQLREAFDESSLPFSVDLLVWDDLSDSFHRNIEAGYVVLQFNAMMGKGTVYGTFSPRFTESNLGNLCEKESGIQTGPFGSQLHQKDYVAEGTPIITVEHIGENRITHQDLPRVSDYDRARLSKYALQTGDIVFSRVGSVDRRSLVRELEDGWLFSGRCLRVRPDQEKIDSGYLSYFLGLPAFREYIRSIAVGATMPSLNTSLLSDVTIYYPPLPEQRAIAHVLGTLDDKIELNRRMNQTLEEMAHTIYKDWFVDFGPVRAKLEGQEPYLAQEIWDLFPDRLVNSELGEIPEGWESRALGKVLTAKNLRVGDIPVPEYSCTNTGVYPRGEHFKKRLSKSNSNNKTIHRGDLIFGLSRRILNFGLMRDRIGCVSGVYKVFSINEHLINPDLAERLIRTNADYYYGAIQGSSREGQSMSSDALNLLKIICPPARIQEVYYSLITPAIRRITMIEKENELLTTQRDNLLPKLVSGEIQPE